MFKNTGVICMVRVKDMNRECGYSSIDLGNFFTSSEGKRVLITSRKFAEKYSHLVTVPVYVRRPTTRASDG